MLTNCLLQNALLDRVLPNFLGSFLGTQAGIAAPKVVWIWQWQCNCSINIFSSHFHVLLSLAKSECWLCFFILKNKIKYQHHVLWDIHSPIYWHECFLFSYHHHAVSPRKQTSLHSDLVNLIFFSLNLQVLESLQKRISLLGHFFCNTQEN